MKAEIADAIAISVGNVKSGIITEQTKVMERLLAILREESSQKAGAIQTGVKQDLQNLFTAIVREIPKRKTTYEFIDVVFMVTLLGIGFFIGYRFF